jgi:hypothetical protein
MERQVWTDERIDDMVDRLEKSIDLLRTEMREGMHEIRGEMHAVRADMAAGFTSLRRDMLITVLVMSAAIVAAMATILATVS